MSDNHHNHRYTASIRSYHFTTTPYYHFTITSYYQLLLSPLTIICYYHILLSPYYHFTIIYYYHILQSPYYHLAITILFTITYYAIIYHTCNKDTTTVTLRLSVAIRSDLNMSYVVEASRPLDTASMNFSTRGGTIISPTTRVTNSCINKTNRYY
jgi:hypothetical protein